MCVCLCSARLLAPACWYWSWAAGWLSGSFVVMEGHYGFLPPPLARLRLSLLSLIVSGRLCVCEKGRLCVGLMFLLALLLAV